MTTTIFSDADGNLELGTTAQPTEIKGALITQTSTPASAGASGVAGTITWDSDYIYICTATDTWKRVAIATW